MLVDGDTVTVSVPGCGHVTTMFTATVPLNARLVYGVASGAAHDAGTPVRLTVPEPLPIGTPRAVYAPAALVVTAGSAAAPVGVTMTPMPASPPPRLLVTEPLTVPVGATHCTTMSVVMDIVFVRPV